jgi:oligopeptide/dipeptide ABC transporter ATP-binding protein
VDDVSFSLAAGQVLALVGESGSGKSMTALSLLRLVPKPGRVDGGRILLDGRNLLELSVPAMRRVRGHDIAMIFQEPMTSLNPVVRVGDQVVEAVLLHERVSKGAARERGIELFKRVGIPDPVARFSAFPHQLSGGLKQRVMIAMALVTRPRVLLADEPTTALDVTTQAQILDLMLDLQREYGMGIMFITHDLGVVAEIADYVAVMYLGRVVESADADTLFNEPKHPYTQALLGSIPKITATRQPLEPIQGMVPNPFRRPTGCSFHPRCAQVMAACPEIEPDAYRISDGHIARCLLYADNLPAGVEPAQSMMR